MEKHGKTWKPASRWLGRAGEGWGELGRTGECWGGLARSGESCRELGIAGKSWGEGEEGEEEEQETALEQSKDPL